MRATRLERIPMLQRSITHVCAGFAVAAGLLFAGTSAFAAGVTVMVTDANGAPVADAVVYAEAGGGQALPAARKPAAIEQKGRRFAPMVTVVQTGTEVSFPNNDTVRHHVYSFSPAKVFELKLYSGTPGSPIVFDKPGTVVVGCNIHDQMVAFIHVVDTPYFARTDASGKAQLDGVPAGKYTLRLWYYKTPTPAQTLEQPLLMKTADATAAFKVIAKPAADN
jgi:plastocyanin